MFVATPILGLDLPVQAVTSAWSTQAGRPTATFYATLRLSPALCSPAAGPARGATRQPSPSV